MTPFEVKGIMLHTYGGLSIIIKQISFENNRREVPKHRELAYSNSFVSALIGIGELLEERFTPGIFRVQKLADLTIIMYFSKYVIGSLITSGDNYFLRDILKKIVLSYEKEVGEIDMSVIHDQQIELAERIYQRYKPLIETI